ncbi:peptidase domain-containing ABC transporter [Trichocoleus sp. ST-U3]|uniref:peptidase domain-containing ABC transporter n=1 Tax=Coleofasciculus sp. FACHB-542 TaxID=2692787 RepID=UPI00168218F6|nr:peptidase domain-containing ABC transporter [Coleofasciculus sp. FACHB-542]MBD2085338.1 peptidase domain-containing ABC transporter [Coleofasciculus sp. FACHB-542]
MTHTTISIKEILAGISPFNQLPSVVLEKVAAKFQFLRYRMGQAMFVRETMPAQIAIIYQGQARLLGYDPRSQAPVTLKLLEPGEILGWVSLIRGTACETAIASTETICLILPDADFLALLNQERSFAAAFENRCSLIEVFDLIGEELARQADGTTNLKELALKAVSDATILNLPPGKTPLSKIDPDWVWLVSGGTVADFSVGSRLIPSTPGNLHVEGGRGVRLLGLQKSILFPSESKGAIALASASLAPTTDWEAIPYAPEQPPARETATPFKQEKHPYIYGRGRLDATLACFQMLSQYLGIPFRRDVIKRVLVNHLKHTENLSLQFCGAVAELTGLNTQLIKVPAAAVCRLQAPAMISWQDSFAILYKISDRELVLAVPEVGILRKKPAQFMEAWGPEGEVLLLRPTKEASKERFSLRWFLPSIYRYRKVLIEVLIASIFVQIFGLVNPLMTQVIIDKVLVQNSIDTLSVLGIFLVVVAAVEAVLTSLRTHLFVDTTNRMDLALGSEVISHLLRLPLSYFERRPVGELATRVNELENIRSFLTGTALTVVLDAIFSVIYIAVMLIYSGVLTLVALATVPLFALLTLGVSPIIRQQSRVKAERNAETHSYLVEVLSGIQTVKAQNLELRSRWQWQERYGRYISAGFKTVSTSTTASSISSFLNKLSSLLVLWAGAYLVLKGELTLGQLIAFRILSGYVTSPLLRLVQLWQNFQETALSLERLGDVLDANLEADETDRHNILMPAIQGSVKFENVSFSFNPSGALQLSNINLDFPAGLFIGIVGQSGSGKSTLTKLLPRLYEPRSGRIIIDDYDISKVELYSLRRQIGMVLQDTLLFDGTVQENIALTNPDASDEEIIEAAKVAFAHDFIMALPNGYNTRVGERGSALSGGQRQRIAIARTVLQNPQLLILDEATSALDYNAERQVCLNLASTFRDRTVFFITHRLTTIRNASLILMMDQGAVVEQGTHDELMALRGRYYCLYQQQEAQL